MPILLLSMKILTQVLICGGPLFSSFKILLVFFDRIFFLDTACISKGDFRSSAGICFGAVAVASLKRKII